MARHHYESYERATAQCLAISPRAARAQHAIYRPASLLLSTRRVGRLEPVVRASGLRPIPVRAPSRGRAAAFARNFGTDCPFGGGVIPGRAQEVRRGERESAFVPDGGLYVGTG